MRDKIELLQKIGQKIRLLRDMRKLSQENMSDALHVSQKTYSNIEKGSADIPISTLYNISEILEISVSNILEFDEENFIKNIFNNGNGNKGVNVMNQNIHNKDFETNTLLLQTLQAEVDFLKEQNKQFIEMLKNKII